MAWVLELVREALRRRVAPRRILRFLRWQLAIRGASLGHELWGAIRDLGDLRRPSGQLLLVAHQHRLRPGGLIELGQSDLCRRLLDEHGATLVRSRLGYHLRAAGATQVFSLEPITCAPPVRFSPRHRSAVLVADPWDKAWMARHLARCRAGRFLTPYLWAVGSTPALRRTDLRRWILFPWWVPDSAPLRRPVAAALRPTLVVVGASGPQYDLRMRLAANPVVTAFLHVSNFERGAPRLDADGYLDLLARQSAAVVAFSASDDLRVPVAKCVEVPAAGALLVAARAHHLDDMGFRDGENCLVFEGVEDFEERVRPFLADPQSFREVAVRGQRLVQERHTTSARLAELMALLSA